MRAIAEEFGIKQTQVWERLHFTVRYQRGREILDADPLSLNGLGLVQAIDPNVVDHLRYAGVFRLTDLCEWSEAEIRAAGGKGSPVGPKRIEQIKAAMAEQGLSLHPDRPIPIPRLCDYGREDPPPPLPEICGIIFEPGKWPQNARKPDRRVSA